MFKKFSMYICWKKNKMGCLEGSGVPVLYIGRTVPKGKNIRTSVYFFFDWGLDENIKKNLRNTVRLWTGFSWSMISSNAGCCEQDNERSENFLTSSRNINFPMYPFRRFGQHAVCPRIWCQSSEELCLSSYCWLACHRTTELQKSYMNFSRLHKLIKWNK